LLSGCFGDDLLCGSDSHIAVIRAAVDRGVTAIHRVIVVRDVVATAANATLKRNMLKNSEQVLKHRQQFGRGGDQAGIRLSVSSEQRDDVVIVVVEYVDNAVRSAHRLPRSRRMLSGHVRFLVIRSLHLISNINAKISNYWIIHA
jgi:hypothetical protein